jgi:hypothetical protein
VQLEDVDGLEAEAPQAHLARLPQVLRASDGRPTARPLARQTGLRRDQQVGRVRVQGLADQLVGDLGPVGVGRVDQLHAELDGPPQHADALVVVARRAPDALARQLHRAEAEPVDSSTVSRSRTECACNPPRSP